MIIIGDTHGIKPLFEIVDKNNLNSENLIHVGDLGLGFQDIYRDIVNLATLEEMLLATDNTLYAIRGNHDNPIFWDKSLGLNLPEFHNLHLVEDYSLINIEAKNVLFAGGATSIDRSSRVNSTPYPTWWKNEAFTFDPIKLGQLIEVHKKIDVVITHSSPDFCYPQSKKSSLIKSWIDFEEKNPISSDMHLKRDLLQERFDITELYNELTIEYNQKPSHWFYGHFHKSRTEKIEDTQFTLLGINEIKELN